MPIQTDENPIGRRPVRSDMRSDILYEQVYVGAWIRQAILTRNLQTSIILRMSSAAPSPDPHTAAAIARAEVRRSMLERISQLGAEMID